MCIRGKIDEPEHVAPAHKVHSLWILAQGGFKSIERVLSDQLPSKRLAENLRRNTRSSPDGIVAQVGSRTVPFVAMFPNPIPPLLSVMPCDGVQLSILTEKLDEDFDYLGISRRSRFGDAMPRLLERFAERSERSLDSRLHESLGCEPSMKIFTESIDPIDHRLS
jgi:hypothetical protein